MRDLNGPKSLIEDYTNSLYHENSYPLITKARSASVELGKAGISMSDQEARTMAVFIKANRAKKFVEIGTLTGATALWISQAMGENSILWTFEKDANHTKIAEGIFKEFMNINPTQKIQCVLGDAQEELSSIEALGPFDGIFIDGNKAAYGHYLDWAEKNIKMQGLIVSDNVFLGGAIFQKNEGQKFSDKQIAVMKTFNQRLADPTKYYSVILPTQEGLSLAIKLF